MQLHTNYKKKNIFIFFSFGVSLKTWDEKKILDREIGYYNELQKNNYKLTFVTYGDKNDLKFKKKIKNIKILPIFRNIKKNFFTKYLIFLIAPFILQKSMNECEIIKSHQISGGLLAATCAFFYKKKLIVRAGWEPTQNYRKWNIGFFKYLLLFLNSLISYKFSEKIITTSSELKNFINKKYTINKNKISIIPNAINVDRFKRFNIKKYKNRAINISRLEHQKNLFKLLDICKSSKLNIDIIGSGKQLIQLKRYANSLGVRVQFVGQIKNNKISKMLSKYMFYLTASKIEGSPKSIMEAMSAELPIFGLKAKGLSSLVVNGKTGYLYSDIKKLSNAIIKNKKNNNHLKKIGKNARKQILRKFSLKKNIILEKKIFDNLINEKQN